MVKILSVKIVALLVFYLSKDIRKDCFWTWNKNSMKCLVSILESAYYLEIRASNIVEARVGGLGNGKYLLYPSAKLSPVCFLLRSNSGHGLLYIQLSSDLCWKGKEKKSRQWSIRLYINALLLHLMLFSLLNL